jgi:hypothetical protein
MVDTKRPRSALLVSELTGFRCEEAMKTAGRENPNRWANVSSNRAHGADGQNRSGSIRWAAKQEKFQPKEKCFLLTAFIELTRNLAHNSCRINKRISPSFWH